MSSEKKQNHVIIIGGGYGGIRAMQKLTKESNISITLIDRNPYHYLQTEAYALIANEATLTDVTVDLVALCKVYDNVTYLKANVKRIDLEIQCIYFQDQHLCYDNLIIASGSHTKFPASIPGLNRYAHGVKTLQRAFLFKQQFEQQLYERMQSEDDLFCKAFNVVIGGAGLSGVEIAAEMGHFARQFVRENRMLCDGIQIYLIASRGQVLEGMPPFLQKTAQKRLKRLGVHVLYNTRISEVKEREVILNSGGTINFDFMIFAGGVEASSLTSSLKCPLNDKGQIRVERTLQILCHQNVYAVGDVAALEDAKGDSIPATANAAEKSAEIVAKNIKLQLSGQRPQHAFIHLEGILVALGGKYASVVMFDIFRVSGYLGYLFKRLITWRYKYLLDSEAFKAYKAFRYSKKFKKDT